ncbi:MAG: serine hydrolase domain-containing protein [Dehalococcoidia bacterium]
MTAFRPDFARLSETAQRILAERHLPGLALGAVVAGEPAWQEAWGWADIAAQQPMTPQHRQRIASITKTMVGLCVMALVDEGRLSLDSRVQDILPDFTFHGPAEGLTVRHLLTHTGGIGETPNANDLAQPFAKLYGKHEPGTSLTDLYTDGLTIEVPPGTKWAYANHGFLLLGEIISRLEGVALPEAMHRRIYEPLGMNDSDTLDVPRPDISHGYHQAATPEARQLLDYFSVELESDVPVDGHNLAGKYPPAWGNAAAGGAQSTVPDMLRYAAALLRASDGIVRPETFAQMITPQWQPDPRLRGWGLSFESHRPFGQRMFGHGGAAMGGWNSFLAVFPDLDAALVIHTNLMTDGFETTTQRPLIQAFLGADNPKPGANLDTQVLATAPGVYEAPDPGPLTNFRVKFGSGRVLIRQADGLLTLYSRRGPWKEGVPLLPGDTGEPDLLLINHGAIPQRLVVLRDGSGDVTGLRFTQLVDMHRNPELQPWT